MITYACKRLKGTADYAEERRSEIEVLESIFPAELTSPCLKLQLRKDWKT